MPFPEMTNPWADTEASRRRAPKAKTQHKATELGSTRLPSLNLQASDFNEYGTHAPEDGTSSGTQSVSG